MTPVQDEAKQEMMQMAEKLFSVHTVFLSPLSDMEARPSVNTAYLDISNVPFLFCKQMHLSINASRAEKSSESDRILQAFSLN